MSMDLYSFVDSLSARVPSKVIKIGYNSVIKDLYNIDSIETNGQPL
jgi:hypothetical protein